MRYKLNIIIEKQPAKKNQQVPQSAEQGESSVSLAQDIKSSSEGPVPAEDSGDQEMIRRERHVRVQDSDVQEKSSQLSAVPVENFFQECLAKYLIFLAL
jgi:hypothetical protein